MEPWSLTTNSNKDIDLFFFLFKQTNSKIPGQLEADLLFSLVLQLLSPVSWKKLQHWKTES